MSDTPETDDIARGNHVVPTEWAQQLERERDEAREKAERYRLDANALMLQRDEAREEAHRFRSLHYSHLGINGSASWFPWEAK
jgi:hypothetical protein